MSVSGVFDSESLRNLIALARYNGQFTLRNFNLNNAFFEGIYVFTLNDNIENIPTVFTDENHFFFLVTIKITSYLDNPIGAESNAQIIFQGHSHGITSDMFIRYQTVDDWQNHVTPPDWVIVP